MNDGDEGFSMDFDSTRHWTANAFTNRGNPLLNPPIIRVYLAGPLTCVNESDSQDCTAIRKITKWVLGSYDHRGIRFDVYDPADVTQPGSNHTAEQVYEVDYRNVVDADLVIFHVNKPSLGVGEESQIAATSLVPRVTIKKRGVEVSRMFDGSFTPAIKIEYGTHAEYEQALSDHLVEIAEHAIRSASQRRPLMEQFEEMQLGRFIFRQRIKNHVRIEELAAAINTKVSWLRYLERKPRIAATASLPLLYSMLNATNASMTQQAGKMPVLKESDDTLDADAKHSLDNLVSYVLSRQEWVSDDIVFRLWQEHVEQAETEKAEALAHRAGDDRIVTVEDWRHRHEAILPPDEGGLFPPRQQ